jgi:outer membrane protein OmpA-like peptidoglycan-associated protein
LAGKRAETVRNLLVDYGVNPNRLIPVSYGEKKVVSSGEDEEDHSKNRRVDCYFLPESPGFRSFLSSYSKSDF